MTLRRAKVEDAPALAKAERGCSPSPWSEESIRSSLLQSTTRAFVLPADGSVIGYLLISVVETVGEVLILGVLPEHRRHGLARSLMEAGQNQFIEEGVVEAFLEVRSTNEAALALYGRLGWTEKGCRKAYYRDGTDAAVMHWEP
jgi:[ribosomal protein S18]-alanine N-acetyltransferase